MTRWLMCILTTALAGGLAFAQETTQQETEQWGEEAAQEVEQQAEQWERQDPAEDPRSTDPMMGEEQDPAQTRDPAAEMEMPQSVADMSADELEGLTIVTQTGEELGEVERVGHSEQHQERVAVVDVGGFLGIGAKSIAVSLSELEMSPGGRLQTSLTRESIEMQEEVDEAGFTDESESRERTDY